MCINMNKTSKLLIMGISGTVIMTTTSLQLIPEQQRYNEKPSLNEIHSGSAFVNNPISNTTLPQKKILIKERPEIKLNTDLTAEQKIKNLSEIGKVEKEKITVTTERKQATIKPPKHSKLKSATYGMGNTRIVNGQKQVYFLGFGWIEDDNKPNEEITAKDMFESGNKVGNMEGCTVMDSDGDIDKMVGTMGD